jgi:hypothetical protein
MYVRTANQVLEPFNWIIGWVDTAPLHHIATIFETEFFPRWINILFQWLTAKPDYEEVSVLKLLVHAVLSYKWLTPKPDYEEVSREVKHAYTSLEHLYSSLNLPVHAALSYQCMLP